MVDKRLILEPRRGAAEMKKVSGMMLALLIIGLFELALSVQPTHTQPEIVTGVDNYPAIQEGTSMVNSLSQDQSLERGNADRLYNENNANPEASTENASLEKHQADDYSRSQVVPNPDSYLPLPDGRIFFDSTAPYGYIPTYNPKNFNMPINATSALPPT